MIIYRVVHNIVTPESAAKDEYSESITIEEHKTNDIAAMVSLLAGTHAVASQPKHGRVDQYVSPTPTHVDHESQTFVLVEYQPSNRHSTQMMYKLWARANFTK